MPLDPKIPFLAGQVAQQQAFDPMQTLGQVMAMRRWQAQAAQDQQQAMLTQQQIDLARQKFEAEQKAQTETAAEKERLKTIMGSPTLRRPDGSFDQEEITRLLTVAGMPEHIPTYTKLFSEIDQHRANAKKASDEHQTAVDNIVGRYAYGASILPEDRLTPGGELQRPRQAATLYFIDQLEKDGYVDKARADGMRQSAQDPTALNDMLQQGIARSPEQQKRISEAPKPIQVSSGAVVLDPTDPTKTLFDNRPKEKNWVEVGGNIVEIGTWKPLYTKPRETSAEELKTTAHLIMTPGANGELEEVLANRDVRGRYFHPKTGAQIMDVRPPLPAELRVREAAKEVVEKNVDQMQELSKKLITEKSRFEQAAKAAKMTVASYLQSNPEFQAYQAARFALAANLAVAQQGSRPSNEDVSKVWLPLVPDVFANDAASAPLYWQLMRNMAGLHAAKGDQPRTPEGTTTTPPKDAKGDPTHSYGAYATGR